jgi:hypothetical protein
VKLIVCRLPEEASCTVPTPTLNFGEAFAELYMLVRIKVAASTGSSTEDVSCWCSSGSAPLLLLLLLLLLLIVRHQQVSPPSVQPAPDDLWG